MSYHLVADNPDHFVVHDASDKSQFMISKKDIHPATQIKIMKLPKFADGTDSVPDEGSDIPQAGQTPDQATVNPSMPSLSDLRSVGPADALAQAPQAQAAPQLALDPGAQTQAQPNALPGMNPLAEVNAANALGVQSANEGQQAATQRAQGETKIYDKQAADLQSTVDDMRAKQQQRMTRNQQLFDAASKDVDPNRYWNSKSTAGKVSSIIGILVSGIGAGLQKSTTNMAVKSLNDQIDRDVEAQKTNITNKGNLYKMYLEQGHSEDEAAQLAKADMLAVTAAQVSKVQAQSGSLQAKAQGDALKSQLGTQAAQLHQQYAASGLAKQAYTDGIPVQAVPYLPKEYQDRMVPLPNGQMADTGSKESADAVKKSLAPYQSTMNILNRLKGLSQGASRFLPGTPEYEQIKANLLNMVPELNDEAGAKRLSDPDIAFQVKRLTDPSSLKSLLSGNAATNELEKIINTKMDSLYGAHVPAYANMKAKRSQAQSRIPTVSNR